MAREVILAFDYGNRRIGVAASGGAFGQPTAQLTIQHSDSLQADIEKLIQEYKPKKLVVGLPHNLEGEETQQSKLCREFAQSLERYKLPVVVYDETLSSERALSRLGKTSRKDRKDRLDAMAAQIILEDYIAYGIK